MGLARIWENMGLISTAILGQRKMRKTLPRNPSQKIIKQEGKMRDPTG